MFSEPEIQYLKSQRLARIATVSSKGQPDVVPVMSEFDGKYFWVGNHGEKARKYKNVLTGNRLVALTIDHIEDFKTWKGSAIRVYGTAEIVDHQGLLGQGKYLRITPKTSWSFGIKGLKNVKTVHH